MAKSIHDQTSDEHAPLEQAKQAIAYTLKRIRDDERIWYHLGFGTQAFSLLIKAYASLEGRPVEDVLKECLPPETEGEAS